MSIRRLLAIVALLTVSSCSSKSKEAPLKGPGGKYTISKETTYITEPLDDAGKPDIIRAVNNRASRDVTPENNAAVIVWQLCGPANVPRPDVFFKHMGMDAPAADGEYYMNLTQYLQKAYPKLGDAETDKLHDQQMRCARSPWKATEYPAIGNWLKTQQPFLDKLRAATKRTHYFSPQVDAKTEPSISHLRTLARGLVTRALQRIEEKQDDEAWNDILSCFRLSRLAARGTNPSSGLLATAIDGMARRASTYYFFAANRTATQLRQCQKDLEGLAALPSIARQLEFDGRLQLLGQFLRLPAGETEALDFALRTPRGSDAGKTLAGLARTEAVNWDLVFRNLNKDVDKILEIIGSKSWPDAIASHDSYSKRRYALAKRMKTGKAIRDHLAASSAKEDALAEVISSTLSDYVMMSHFAAIEADARGRQAAQLSHVALALRIYALEKGSYPDSLSPLVPDFVPELPKDFFSGGVPRYLKSNEGFLVYSVGPDRQDTQGKNRSDPPGYRGDDLRIRVPLQAGSISP